MVEDQDQSPDLRALREAQKLDLATLSSATSLSVAQLRELEEGGSGHFYSDTIKQQALRRVLRHLGVATEPMAANSSLGTPAPDGSGQQNQGVIQGIIRLSQAGDQFEDPRFPTTRHMEMPGWVGWLAVLLGLVIVLVWTYPYEEVDEFLTGLKERFSSPTTQTVSVQPTASPALATASDDKPGEANAAAPAAAGKEASVTVTEVTPLAIPPAPATSAPAPVPAPAPTPAPAPEPAPAPVVAKAAANPPSACEDFKSEPVQASPISIDKPAQYVYLIAKSSAVVCAVDGQGKLTRLELSAGVGRSVYGPAPWVLSSKEWATVDVFFQGSKVVMPSGAATRVRLVEQPVNNRPAQINSNKN